MFEMSVIACFKGCYVPQSGPLIGTHVNAWADTGGRVTLQHSLKNHLQTTNRENTSVQSRSIQIMFHISVSHTESCSTGLWCLWDALTSAARTADTLLETADVMSCEVERCATIHHCRLSMRRGKEKKWEKGGKCCSCVHVYVYVCACVCVWVRASSQTRCLVTQCVRPGPSELIKYPFAVNCAVDATVSIATGSAELHNIRLCLLGALLWLLPRLPSSIIMP